MPHDPNLKTAREITSSLVRSMASDMHLTGVTKGQLIHTGHVVWSLSLRWDAKMKDHEVLTRLQEYLSIHKTALSQQQQLALVAIALLPDQQLLGIASARWYDQGLPVIRVGHKYAAALAATHTGKVDLSDLLPPWNAFLIELPYGLFTILDDDSGKRVNATLLMVHHTETTDGDPIWNYICLTDSPVTLWKHGCTTNALTDPSPESSPWDGYDFIFKGDDADERVSQLLARVIINVCLATSGKGRALKRVGAGHKSHAKSNRKDDSPRGQRVFELGAPIKLDCREAVRDYVEGRRGHVVSVQSLVMGHWKRQAHGPQRSLRKWAWIEPYWRGPEDAPVLHRPHDIENEQS